MKQKIKQLQSFILLLMISVMSTATAWGAAVTYNCTSSTDVTTLNSTSSQITVGSGTNTFYIYSANSLKTKPSSSGFSLATDKYQVSQTSDMIVVFVPTTSDNVSNIEFYASTSNTRKAYYKSSTDATTLTSSPSTTADALATTSTSYSLWNSFSKGTYYAFGGQTGGSGKVYIHKVVVTFSGSSTYTVSYNMNGHGDAIPDATDRTTLPNPLPSPTATGYTFGGWYTDSGLSSAATAGASIADDTPLYAKWTLNVPTFSPESGSRINPTDNVTISGIANSYVYAAWGASAIDAATLTVEDNKKTFNGSGNFTAGASGTGTRVLSARAYDGTLYSDVVSATYYIRTANTLALNTSSGSVTVGDGTLDISVYVKSKNNTSTTVTYTSNNTSVATVSSAGVITPVAAGTTTITVAQVQTDDYTAGEATFTVTVNAAATLYTVTFNANGHGTLSATSDTQASAGTAVTLATVTPVDDTNHKYAFASWNTADDGSGTTISAPYVPTSNITIYAQYTKTHHKVLSSVATGSGTVAMTNASTSATIAPGSWVEDGTAINVVATPATGYQWNSSWGDATGLTTATLSNFEITDAKDFSAHFTAKTYSITIDDNGGSADGSATATYNSNKLTGITAPTYAGKMVEGYYKESGCTNKIADASGNLVASTAYTNGSSQWTNDAATTVTLYAKWVDASAADTSLPVTFDFTASPWSTSTDLKGATSGLTILDTSNDHNIYFRGSSQQAFSIVSGQHLQIASNASTSNYIAIPISGINGRIDIDVWAPYGESSDFTINAILVTGSTTLSTPNSIANATLGVNKYVDEEGGYFNFRIKDLTATNGVLYIGRANGTYKQIDKIRITSPSAYLVPSETPIVIGDDETKTITITNNSIYQALLRTVPSYVDASYSPATGELVITPKTTGKNSNITLAVDENGDGSADSDDLTIPVTVYGGITIGTQPQSAVYETGALADALTVTASSVNIDGSLSYQWYKNTVNSNTGGTAISGATLSSYTPSTSATEEAAFYYCVVSYAKCKSVASNVAYVLTSSSKRYFQMSNVAGNKETSTNDEKITGQVIAGGDAYVQTSGNYRYITRPSTTVAHTYVASSSGTYFKIELGQDIKATDMATVLINDLGGNRGITISSTDGTKTVTINAGSASGVNSYAASLADLVGETTLLVKGVYGGLSNYFTDLVFYEAAPLVVTSPTPASQSIQVGDTPATISVSASGGDGDYSYQWYSNDEANTTSPTPISGATSASYTPSAPGSAGTTYYYCLVESQSEPTGYASVTATAATHGYLTPTFTDNVATYITKESNYTSDGGEGSTKFWKNNNSGADFNNKKISALSSDEIKYLRLKKKDSSNGSMTFYVKNATAFSFYHVGNNDEVRKLKVEVNGENMGEFSTNGSGEESSVIALNSAGSTITFTHVSGGDKYIGRLTFYEKQPSTIEIQKDGVKVTEETMLKNGSATTYEVVSNSDGALSLAYPTDSYTTVTNGYQTANLIVTLDNGVLTVTPRASTGDDYKDVTINQADYGDYKGSSTTLKVKVTKPAINLAFSYDKVNFKATSLTKDNAIPSGSLPTLTATYDDGSAYEGTINYQSDEPGVGYFDSSTTYSVKYGGGQGGARIYAYVNETDDYAAEVAYFDLVVENGTSNNLPKGTSISVQQQFDLHNAAGQTVVTLTYGGYKYNSNKHTAKEIKNGAVSKKEKSTTDSWVNAEGYNSYFIDGYQYNTHNENDAYNEYGYQLRGMNDDYNNYTNTTDCPGGMWYKTNEIKPDGSTNYSDYERIRPFALACKGGYLKFEPKKSGVLTAYVLQNGVIQRGSNKNQLGSKPRLGYWFDQDGWVQHPTAVITKQPISNGNGRNTHNYTCNGDGEDGVTRNLDAQMDYYWTATKGDDGDKDIIPMLRNRYTNSENPDVNSNYSNTNIGYENPYWWPENDDVITNNNQIIPRKMKPVPYHNGYMVPEQTYVKYTLPVIAGKTYYFYGMMTKIGYVGMNFVEDEDVLVDAGINHEAETLHLQTTDNMGTYTFNGNVLSGNTLFDEVTLPSNYKANKWNTICLPFALSENQVEEAFGKGTQLAIYNGLEHSSTEHVYYVKYLRHVDQNILPGQPYLIYPTGVDASGGSLDVDANGNIGSAIEGQSNTRITFNTVLIDKSKLNQEYADYGSNTDVGGGVSYKFVGTYAPYTMEKYTLFYSPVDGKMYRWMKNTGTFAPYHAVMKPISDNVKQDGLSFTFEDEPECTWLDDENDVPTSIIKIEDVAEMLNSGKIQISNKAYNLMGQEVDLRSAKGLVIINGKKVMY